jgi:CheY-like chemotaxis protein
MYKRKISDAEQKYSDDKMTKLNILIVDDDDDARESLKYMIQEEGHNVVDLDEGMKCVNRCSENKFDVIFMDYHIKDLDGELSGTDVTQMVKEYFNNDSWIYAYTGDSTEKAIKKFKENNMKGVFIKPITQLLMRDFMKIFTNDRNDTQALSKLAMKSKNFIHFGKNKKN